MNIRNNNEKSNNNNKIAICYLGLQVLGKLPGQCQYYNSYQFLYKLLFLKTFN